ncbi:hypothetical protein GLDPPO_GLDPPO_13765, partial [Dysosmobacter welbionis]
AEKSAALSASQPVAGLPAFGPHSAPGPPPAPGWGAAQPAGTAPAAGPPVPKHRPPDDPAGSAAYSSPPLSAIPLAGELPRWIGSAAS